MNRPAKANDDLYNVLFATEVGTIFIP